MKKTLFILGAIGTLLIANFTLANWSEPTGTPPNNNVPAPINVGTVPQTKMGDLTIDTKLQANTQFVLPRQAPITPTNGSMWLQ